MKILLLDIETSPNTAHVWGLWQQNVSINQLMESSYVLCYAAKWLDNEEVLFDSVHQSKPKKMLKGIHGLLNEADAVVHYNGTKFDIPTLNKEFLLHSYNPPSPYKQIDLDQNLYSKACMEQVAHDRVREIQTWSKIKAELDDGLPVSSLKIPPIQVNRVLTASFIFIGFVFPINSLPYMISSLGSGISS